MDNKKQIEMRLLKNPAYSSAWIDSAAKLMDKCSIEEVEIKEFNTEQLDMILSVFTSAEKNPEIRPERFMNPELNATQMQVILTGYSHGLTTEQLLPYFNPSIPYIKSNWAIAALVEGHDMHSYIEAGYDEDQIYEIYSGFKSGVDVEKYDGLKISAEKMAVARHALEMGLEIHFSEKFELTIM